MRLINVDELKLPQHFFETVDNVPKFYEWLNEQPTIDAVPVVRCKDCKWHEQEQPGMVYCPATVGGWVEDDWFCKGGEREDDE